MQTTHNLILQSGSVAIFIALRLTSPGWLMVMAIFTGLGLLVFAPIALAVWVRRCRRLDAAATAAFLALAGSLIATGALVGDYTDAPGTRIPLLMLTGVGEVGNDSEWLVASQAGSYCVLAYLVLLGVTWWQSRRSRRHDPHSPLSTDDTASRNAAIAR